MTLRDRFFNYSVAYIVFGMSILFICSGLFFFVSEKKRVEGEINSYIEFMYNTADIGAIQGFIDNINRSNDFIDIYVWDKAFKIVGDRARFGDKTNQIHPLNRVYNQQNKKLDPRYIFRAYSGFYKYREYFFKINLGTGNYFYVFIVGSLYDSLFYYYCLSMILIVVLLVGVGSFLFNRYSDYYFRILRNIGAEMTRYVRGNIAKKMYYNRQDDLKDIIDNYNIFIDQLAASEEEPEPSAEPAKQETETILELFSRTKMC